MSLVPTWVHVGNDKYAKNLVIYFKEGFICFDDDDPPEIVIRIGHAERLTHAIKVMENILTRLHIPWKPYKRASGVQACGGEGYSRCFKSLEDDFEDAYCMLFCLIGPVPEGLDIKHGGIERRNEIGGDHCLEGVPE